MKHAIPRTILMSCAAWLAFGQSSDGSPKFEAADVHTSVKATTANQFVRSGTARGRYEIKTATMVDLIRLAYGFDQDKILGGPSWLEMDRFDVVAKVPPETDPDTQKVMLQALLVDRFKLVVHKEDKPLPTYALSVGKKPLLKEADGSGQTGCRPHASSPGAGGGGAIMFGNADGTTSTIAFGPGMQIQYDCRNVTMTEFVANLRSMFGANLGTNPVLDETGLKGKWNFDIQYSLQLNGGPIGDTGDHVSFAQAVDKELGLKLEQKPVPTPVIVVDSVNEKPTPNPPELAETLPPTPVPTEFEVASVKPSDPNARMGRFQMQPGGRLVCENMALSFLINRALNTNNSEEVVGIPGWASTERFDIIAKAPAGGSPGPGVDNDFLAPMMRALLADRFKMTYHKEERPVTAYVLASVKPKMKKADPASRTSCKYSPAPAGSPPGSQVLTCQNITMEQFADRLQNMAQGLSWPILNATEIEGGWDFSLTFSRTASVMMAVGRGGAVGDAGAAQASVAASDPTGGYTIFDAIEKQLGLKLEKQQRPAPVFVIDHIEQKPTEN